MGKTTTDVGCLCLGHQQLHSLTPPVASLGWAVLIPCATDDPTNHIALPHCTSTGSSPDLGIPDYC
jgi:hypothetical protein